VAFRGGTSVRYRGTRESDNRYYYAKYNKRISLRSLVPIRNKRDSSSDHNAKAG
jgi:hypothetical protein